MVLRLSILGYILPNVAKAIYALRKVLMGRSRAGEESGESGNQEGTQQGGETQNQGGGESSSQGGSSGSQGSQGGSSTQGGSSGSQSQTSGGSGSGDEESQLPSLEEMRNWDPERFRATLINQREAEREARRQARQMQGQLSELQTRLQQYEERDQTEQQRVQQELANERQQREQLQKEIGTYQKEIRRSKFINQVSSSLPIDLARLAYNAQGDVGVELQWDDGNNPKNLDAYLEAVRKQYPKVMGLGSANGGVHEEERPVEADMNRLMRSQLGHAR